MNFVAKIKKIPFHTAIFLGMLLGFAFGYFLPAQTGWVEPLGTIFLKLLRMLVGPLVLVSIVDGICRAGSIEKLSRLGLGGLGYYFSTTAMAVFTGLVAVNLIRPGEGVTVFGEKPEVLNAAGPVFDLIPDNIFRALAEGNTLQIVFVAVCFGIALVVMGERTSQIRKLAGEANDFLLTLTTAVISFAPLGVFGLMAVMAQSLDWSALSGVLKFALTILSALAIHALVLAAIYKAFTKKSIRQFIRNVQPALLTAFSTSSSSATLPVSLNCIEKREGVSKEVAGFMLPVGATINMDGTAIYEATACIFIAQALGIDLSLSAQVIVFLTATLAAVGAASIPSAGLITLAIVLTAVNLPLEGIGFLLAFDRPLDMSRTVVNVWGDMVGCAVVESRQGKQPVRSGKGKSL